MTTQEEMEKQGRINIDDLNIVDWLWDLYHSDPEFPEGSKEEIDALDLDNGGENVVIYVGNQKDFALVYRNNGAVPSQKELEIPLEDEFFQEDGSWDDEAVQNYLNKFATLAEIVRII